MNEIIVIVFSALYVTSLAIIDGLFNRLVFKDKRKLSYFSSHKKSIYTLWEWKAIGASLLIFLPIVLPSAVAYLTGGIPFVTLYWIVLLLVPWDMIFGALVFGNWFGDRPSIALPFYGWINSPLKEVMIGRIILAIVLIALKIKFGI